MTEEQVKQKTSEEKLKEIQLAYSRVFSSEHGQKVLEDLEMFCGYNNSSVCEQRPDALQTHYNEGKRRVYLRIMNRIKKGKTL